MQPTTTYRTVTDYITDARVLLQDTIEPFRYDDDSLLMALNASLLEVRRIRPDLLVYVYGDMVPTFNLVDSTPVCIEQQFRQGIVYGICAHAHARDQEDYQDARVTAFMGWFQATLVGTAMPSMAGGSAPAPGGR